MHLAYVHRMRAIAIVAIVFVHAIDQIDWGPDSRTLMRFLEDLFQGSTVLFFMIAGFLFHHLSRRFDYQDYLLKKVKNVLIPYVLISAPGIAAVIAKPAGFVAAHPEMADAPNWLRVAHLYFYGGSQLNYPLWFVPVMATLFLMAPLFVALFKRPRLFAAVIAVGLIYSLVSHRPDVGRHHHVALTLYYLSPYLLGMWASMYREPVNRWVDAHVGLLATLSIGLLMGFFLLTPYEGGYVDEPFAFEKGPFDWILLQKLVVFFLLIGLLRKLEHRKMPALEYLADVSFPIFFLHVYMMLIYYHLTHWHVLQGSILSVLTLVAVGIGGSIATVLACRLIFRRHSRLVIGA